MSEAQNPIQRIGVRESVDAFGRAVRDHGASAYLFSSGESRSGSMRVASVRVVSLSRAS